MSQEKTPLPLNEVRDNRGDAVIKQLSHVKELLEYCELFRIDSQTVQATGPPLHIIRLTAALHQLFIHDGMGYDIMELSCDGRSLTYRVNNFEYKNRLIFIFNDYAKKHSEIQTHQP